MNQLIFLSSSCLDLLPLVLIVIPKRTFRSKLIFHCLQTTAYWTFLIDITGPPSMITELMILFLSSSLILLLLFLAMLSCTWIFTTTSCCLCVTLSWKVKKPISIQLLILLPPKLLDLSIFVDQFFVSMFQELKRKKKFQIWTDFFFSFIYKKKLIFHCKSEIPPIKEFLY